MQIRKYKKNLDYSYALGVFPTIELLNSRPADVLRVLISSKGEKNSGVLEILSICKNKNIKADLSDKLINRLSPKENCYAIGLFRKFRAEIKGGENHLILVNPSDMGNLGTIMRTMLGFDINNLAIINPAVDIFNPRAIRSSMGAIFRISFQYFGSIEHYINIFDNNLYPFMTNGKITLDEISFQQPFSIIFGSESSGLSGEYLNLGTSVKILHSDAIDSFNLSISAGIGLYKIFENNRRDARNAEEVRRDSC